MELDFTVKQEQTFKFTAKMIQAVEILQMGAQELESYIVKMVQENPVMETEPAQPEEGIPVHGKDAELLQRKAEWLDACDWQNHHYHHADQKASPYPLQENWRDWNQESVVDHLLDQLPRGEMATEEKRLVLAVIENIDHRGYFVETLEIFAREWQVDPAAALRALTYVQSMEPAGVGARSLSECLALQLLRLGETGLPLVIAQGFLQEVSGGRYNAVAQQTGASPQEVRAAYQIIKTLNPKPGSVFSAGERVEYVIPDLLVAHEEGALVVLPLRNHIPTLRISHYYQALAKETTDEEVKSYLEEKMRQAQWVMQGIEQRGSTLLACARSIVQSQNAFFGKGPGHLGPLSLLDVAQQVGFHESTVSRAIKGKWIQCDFGIFPLGSFFSRSLGKEEEAVSSDRAKGLLAELLAGEDKKKPLSDERLAAQLQLQGIAISRRTVAKYRVQLNIPSTGVRREY